MFLVKYSLKLQIQFLFYHVTDVVGYQKHFTDLKYLNQTHLNTCILCYYLLVNLKLTVRDVPRYLEDMNAKEYSCV